MKVQVKKGLLPEQATEAAAVALFEAKPYGRA
jgi:hypothetical protein